MWFRGPCRNTVHSGAPLFVRRLREALGDPHPSAREKLNQVADSIYQKMDQLYQGKMYFPGYFPNELRSIFREQVHLLQNAIIQSRIDCQRHCGIFQYETISCSNCTDSHVVCFGYNCE